MNKISLFRILQRSMSQNVAMKLLNNAEIAEEKLLELKNKVSCFFVPTPEK